MLFGGEMIIATDEGQQIFKEMTMSVQWKYLRVYSVVIMAMGMAATFTGSVTLAAQSGPSAPEGYDDHQNCYGRQNHHLLIKTNSQQIRQNQERRHAYQANDSSPRPGDNNQIYQDEAHANG